MTLVRAIRNERRDAVAFLSAEAKRFDEAASAIPTNGNEAVFRALERERLTAVAAAARTWAAYLARGDHEGAADR